MKSTLLLNADTAGIVAVALPGGEVRAFARPVSSERINQDSAGVFDLGDGRCVLAVADGMGGGPSGERASRLALETLSQQLEASEREERPLRAGILDGFELANERIREQAPGAATTLVVMEIRPGQVRTYHVGDSGACVFGQRGKLKLLTDSHSPVGYALRSGLLDEQDAMHHEDRHFVSNMLGMAEMSVEVGSPTALGARDTIVLGSDGLFDNLSAAEIVVCCRAGPLEGAVARLIGEVESRMLAHGIEQPSKPDDLAVLVHRFRRPRG